MAKVEPARYRSRPHQVACGELVDRRQSILLRQAGRDHGEIEFKRVSRNGARLGQTPGRPFKAVELAGDGATTTLGTSAFPAATFKPWSQAARMRASSSR